MDDLSLQMILLLLAFGFLASFIDSVVGGGGLISLPALLFVGLPPSAAIATNKMASTMGSLTSTLYFISKKKANMKLTGRLMPFTIIGATIGAFVVKYLSPDVMRPLMLVLLLAVAIYIFVKKDWGSVATYGGLTKKKMIGFTFVIMVIGFYDGFFGPGTGSFLIFAFLMIGLDFIGAAASGRILNFTSNLTSLVVFFFLGEIQFIYGLIMGGAMIVGAFAGTRFAMKQGVGYIRILFLIVTTLLIGKNVLTYFHIL